MADIIFMEERCKGCGICVMTCPKQLIRLNSRINRAGYAVAEVAEKSSCTGCALCAEMCPDVVITVFK